MNGVALSHLMLVHSGLPERLQDDLRLKIDGNLERHEELKALILRIAKQQQAQQGVRFPHRGRRRPGAPGRVMAGGACVRVTFLLREARKS